MHSIVTALEPWLFQGDPDHYKSKGVNLFQTKQGKFKWLQIGEIASNPYNDKISERINWPKSEVKKKVAVDNQDKTPKETRGSSMRGSHGH